MPLIDPSSGRLESAISPGYADQRLFGTRLSSANNAGNVRRMIPGRQHRMDFCRSSFAWICSPSTRRWLLDRSDADESLSSRLEAVTRQSFAVCLSVYWYFW